MTIARIGQAGLLSGILAATFLSASLAAGAPAQQSRADEKPIVEPIAHTGASAQSGSIMTTSARGTYLGSAPYICTPSGFGERSKCFLRSRLQTRGR